METENNYETNKKISEICYEYQEERASGRWYITQTGLNKVSKLLGGKYTDLTKTQKAIFRHHCVNTAQGHWSVKNWEYYISI